MANDFIAGRYRFDELIGRSGMSEVWAATDTELGRRVALKLLAPDADTARFEREARAVASLGHPNITQLYDYGEADGRPYMVLEYLPGGTLEQRLRDGRPLPDADATRISAELAAGLAHAHARNVVHRDLKPANVLFDAEGRAKLADFGIARMAAGEGTLTEAGTVLGTAAYISPEQASGSPATPASDVYSFGVLLYRMLTGRLPFEASNAMDLVALHRDAEPPPVNQYRKDAPPLLESVAGIALAKNPADRPPDGAALLAALGVTAGFSTTVVAGSAIADLDATSVLPVSAGAVVGATGPAPPSRRGRLPIAVAALLVLLLAGAALAYELTRPASGSTPAGTLPSTTPTQSTTTAGPTTASSTTALSASTQQTTTASQPTTAPRTTAQTPTTVTTPAAPPTTAPAPPTTTPAPSTTTAPPTTTATATAGP